jgi:hypothetical protein
LTSCPRFRITLPFPHSTLRRCDLPNPPTRSHAQRRCLLRIHPTTLRLGARAPEPPTHNNGPLLQPPVARAEENAFQNPNSKPPSQASAGKAPHSPGAAFADELRSVANGSVRGSPTTPFLAPKSSRPVSVRPALRFPLRRCELPLPPAGAKGEGRERRNRPPIATSTAIPLAEGSVGHTNSGHPPIYY